MMLACSRCKETKPDSEFYLRYDRGPHIRTYRSECRTCFRAIMEARHDKVKRLLVAEAGGRCARCGYDRSYRVLTFHHIDPSTKEFGISKRLSVSVDTLRKETEKCLLLCPNCHAEKHLGIW